MWLHFSALRDMSTVKNYDLADFKFYLPIDTKANALDFIELINPSIAIFVKYDFWFNYLELLATKTNSSFIFWL